MVVLRKRVRATTGKSFTKVGSLAQWVKMLALAYTTTSEMNDTAGASLSKGQLALSLRKHNILLFRNITWSLVEKILPTVKTY